jgi:hypothetical protein
MLANACWQLALWVTCLHSLYCKTAGHQRLKCTKDSTYDQSSGYSAARAHCWQQMSQLLEIIDDMLLGTALAFGTYCTASSALNQCDCAHP